MRIYLELPEKGLEELLEFYVGAITGHRLERGLEPWRPSDLVEGDGPLMESFAAIANGLYNMAIAVEGYTWADAQVDRINWAVVEHQQGIQDIGRQIAGKFDTLLPDRLQGEIDQLLGG